MDAQMLWLEEFASGMGLKSNDAVVKDAQIISSREEFVRGMGQMPSYAAKLDAQTKL